MEDIKYLIDLEMENKKEEKQTKKKFLTSNSLEDVES